ncbi:MAG TPA: hemin-degrading factor [Verrucomicrobia bacterium]|nr:hemin-degrading factor [Kiritimatiellaceae bacterium]HBO87466.1 hemin-degrading factor [Verrucomicrobiota bacterium]
MSVDYQKKSEKIAEKYNKLKNNNPMVRARDAAMQIGISEGELIASRLSKKIIRLSDSPEDILLELESFGEVMALTRNEHVVHERHGIYSNGSFGTHGQMRSGIFLNPDIDLRLFMNHWKFCFSVIEESSKRILRSFQFFDQSGTAIHKVYVLNDDKHESFLELTDKYKNTEQMKYIETVPEDKKNLILDDGDIDWQEFRFAWENLKDTHDFFPMIKKFKVERQQAFRKIGHDFAYLVGNNSARTVLNLARDKGCEIMVFVGNKGCIQIHSGPVEKLAPVGDWFNVLDPKFNLHLNEESIATTWVTKKPTVDGIVTALELFDGEGGIIATFFGKRKPGIPELDLWRQIVAEIPAEESSING